MAKQRYEGRKTRTALLLAGSTISIMAYLSHEAQAVTITVNGSCSLAQAIGAVNSKQKVGGCAAGTGGDTIVIAAGSTILQSSPLTITRSVTIQTSTASKKATIQVPDGVSPSTVFVVSPLPGTAAAVGFTDLRMFGHLGVRAIGATGHNGTDKLNVNRCEIFSFGESAVFGSEIAVNVSDSYIHDNQAQLGAGVRIEGNGNNNVLTISRSSFVANVASDVGGAIYDTAAGHSKITNSTFAHNQADFGGALALLNSGATFDIDGSTIAWNTADFSGAGGVSAAQTNFTTTLIAANTVGGLESQPSDWDFNSIITSFKDSLLGNTFSLDASGNGGIVPMINIGANSIRDVADPFNGVVNPDPLDVGGDMAEAPPVLLLAPSSPAIDAVPSVGSNLATDQRGFQRGVDSDGGVGSNRFDIGAVEQDVNVQAETLLATSVNNGTLSQVTNQAGFLPTLGSNVGKGIKFVPNAVGSSVQFRLPINRGGGTSLVFHIQSCPTCGTYRVDIQDDEPKPPSVSQVGSKSFSSATTKVVTLSPLSLFPGFLHVGQGQQSIEENDNLEIKFTLQSKPANSNGQMVLDFIRFEP